ncbi:hypothetical protein Ait01nite_077000 [Actinoplanes italicus]|uniref:Uncharacterized protein DUF2625 n=1 Tax=Actinoplanes italicus TaxID=113567 RepID=A0A2T0JZ15_9ACTN|nr:DUF2625 family protein [Actinoplanes italicus]PRX14790.1 uncharacterized protein DUF2625 [Actinoplanes italicus]GIE34655.1 hypothetical protein Ait01nite_077000 [Actinoplanes italicus]
MNAWNEVAETIAAAPYPVRALTPDPVRAEAALAAFGITTRSWLGAVVANTGGLLVDHGWLRVLGSGADGLPDVTAEADPGRRGVVVAYDVLGGVFDWRPADAGRPPTVHYYAPDTLDWQDLEQGYTDWLYAVLAGSLTAFYETLRWPGWEAEVGALAPDRGLTVWPPPSTVEGADLSLVSRAPAPLLQVVAFNQ